MKQIIEEYKTVIKAAEENPYNAYHLSGTNYIINSRFFWYVFSIDKPTYAKISHDRERGLYTLKFHYNKATMDYHVYDDSNKILIDTLKKYFLIGEDFEEGISLDHMNLPTMRKFSRDIYRWTWTDEESDHVLYESELDGIVVRDDVVERWDKVETKNSLSCLRYDLRLVDGRVAKIKSGSRHTYWSTKTYLCVQKDFAGVAAYVPIYMDDGVARVAVGIDGYWGSDEELLKMRNNESLGLFIKKYNMDLPHDFSWNRARFHFYARELTREAIEEYVYGDCDCDRCSGFDLYYEEKGVELDVPDYLPLDKLHPMMALWAGRHGYFPKPTDMFECDCYKCRQMRETDKWKRLGNKLKVEEFVQLVGEDVASYYTIGYNMDIDYDIWNLPTREEDIDFDKFSVRGTTPASPTRVPAWNLKNVEIKYQLAWKHCFFSKVRFKDRDKETERWLKEVFNSLLEPECNCVFCRRLKKTEYITKQNFHELILDNVDARSYPIILFDKHFSGRYYTTTEAMKDYFKNYILQGTYCQCDRCRDWINKAEYAEYIPPEELKTPKCVICGNPVHNSQLIFESGDVAKAVIEQGLDRYIGARSGLCCSCFGAQKRKVEKMERLEKAGDSSIIQYEDESGRILKGVLKTINGTKMIGDIKLSTFLNEYEDSFSFVRYIKSKEEKKEETDE